MRLLTYEVRSVIGGYWNYLLLHTVVESCDSKQKQQEIRIALFWRQSDGLYEQDTSAVFLSHQNQLLPLAVRRYAAGRSIDLEQQTL